MSAIAWIFDATLAAALVAVAWRALSSDGLITCIALFVAFGLLMTLAWVRLSAPDIALAEAGIGAGFTGALFLASLARLHRLLADGGRHGGNGAGGEHGSNGAGSQHGGIGAGGQHGGNGGGAP